MLKPRRFIRHPSDVPLEVYAPTQTAPALQLHDVSRGGLSFKSECAYAVGDILRLRVTCVRPTFDAHACVAWCREDARGYTIGVTFASDEDLYAARMVEQLCYIERYKREVLLSEGRSLNGQEAALEWIRRFAGDFPAIDDE